MWRDTDKIYENAQKAADEGNAAKAVKLAHEARLQAENALNQYFLEMASYLVRGMEEDGKQSASLNAAKDALLKKDGKKAYEFAKK